MVTPTEPEKETRTPKVRVSDEDAKLIERATRRGTATEHVGTMVFEGTEKVEIEDVLDEQLVLIERKAASGRHGEFVIMHLLTRDTGKHISVATGGQVVVRKAKELEEKRILPCLVTLIKVNDYYDLT